MGRLLCPMYRKDNIKFYCSSIKIRNIFNDLEYVTEMDKADVILYNNINEFTDLTCHGVCKVITVEYDDVYIYPTITHIKSFLKILSAATMNTYDKICDFIKLKKVLPYKVIYTKYHELQQQIISMKKDMIYIINREGFVFTRNIISNVLNSVLIDNYFINTKSVGFIIEGNQDKEPLIFYKATKNEQIHYKDILATIDITNPIVIGRNRNILSDEDIMSYYYTLGRLELTFGNDFIHTLLQSYMGLILNFQHGTAISKKVYDKDKFIRIMAYWLGKYKYELDIDKISDFIKIHKEVFATKNIMLISKALNSYGGNQKTSIQLYNILIRNGFRVNIVCLVNFDIVHEIHNNDVIISRLDNLANLINAGNYLVVIVNKLNEYFRIKKDVKINDIILTHNSLDPFNELIGNNVSKILTVNSDGIGSLYENRKGVPISMYVNHVDTGVRGNIKHNKFFNRVLFVGRLSREKNLPILTKAWDEVTNINDNLELYIVGSGDEKYVTKHKNITYIGQQNFKTILMLLMKCDYLILPSSTEGMSFSMLEAMSMGIPVISSDIIGSNEVVIDKKTGFLFNLHGYDPKKYKITSNWDIFNNIDSYFEENVLSLKETILRAYSIDFSEWSTISNTCYNMIKNCYSLEKSTNRLLTDLMYFKKILIIDEINTASMSNKIYDIKQQIDTNDYYKYDFIIKINKKNILNDMILSKLYRLKHECSINNIHHIEDNFKNYIIFACNKSDISIKLEVESIYDMLSI